MSEGRDIRVARPNLSVVAPLTNALVWVYAIFNLAVAYALYTQRGSTSLVIYGGLTPPLFWAGVFILLALLMLYAEIKNDWKVIKNTFIFALLIKSIFAYSLLYLAFKTGFTASVGTLALWGLATFTQAAVVIYFPQSPGGNKGE